MISSFLLELPITGYTVHVASKLSLLLSTWPFRLSYITYIPLLCLARPLTVAPNQGMAYRQPGPQPGPQHYPYAAPAPLHADDDDDEFYPAEDMPQHPHMPAPTSAPAGPMPRPAHPVARSLMRQPRIRGSAENLVGKVMLGWSLWLCSLLPFQSLWLCSLPPFNN
jgi:hypothetical protein